MAFAPGAWRPFEKGRAKTGGRKKGTLNKTTLRKLLLEEEAREQRLEAEAQLKEEMERAIARITTMPPLEVMLMAMHLKLNRGDIEGAVQIAERAAPYTSPRLNATDVTVQHTHIHKSDDEVAAEIQALQQKLATAQHPLQIKGTALPSADHNQDDTSQTE